MPLTSTWEESLKAGRTKEHVHSQFSKRWTPSCGRFPTEGGGGAPSRRRSLRSGPVQGIPNLRRAQVRRRRTRTSEQRLGGDTTRIEAVASHEMPFDQGNPLRSPAAPAAVTRPAVPAPITTRS